jgi:cytochrome c biogenesis protein CcmG, thiol:disulfide interchange protein DsbE
VSTDTPSIPTARAPRVAALVVGLAVVALIALFIWGLGKRGTVGQVALVTRPAPDFEVGLFGQPGSASGPWRLTSFSDQPAIVNFWASWCVPCEEEAPALERVARRYRDRVAFIGVDVQDTDQNARGFLDRFRVTYPNGPDLSGEVSIAYGMSGVPETYFVTRDQKIVRKWAGPLDEDQLVGFIEELLR